MSTISPSGVSGLITGRKSLILEPSAGPVNYSVWQAKTGQTVTPFTPPTTLNDAAYSGPFVNALQFMPIGANTWFEGYYFWWPNNGQANIKPKCCLWSLGRSAGGSFIPSSVVSFTNALVPGAWNFQPLSQPVPLAIGDSLYAAVGYTAVAGFADSANWFNTGVDIKNGPLLVFGGTGGTSYFSGGAASPWAFPQGGFNDTNADPTQNLPGATSGTDNFCVDILVAQYPQGQVPSSYTGTFRCWPNAYGMDALTGGDSPVQYVVGQEIWLSRAVTLHNVWFCSPPSSPNLPTAIDVWQIGSNPTSGINVATNASPTWLTPSGSAASAGSAQWMKASISGTIGPGKFKVSVYNANGTVSPGWNCKREGYYIVGASGQNQNGCIGATGTYCGPLYTPQTSLASECESYQNTGVLVPGQSPFAVGPPDQYPNLYVGSASPGGDISQFYYIDLEVS